MTYENLRNRLLGTGYERVERDDRLLDVFLRETREKGVELWQKWLKNEISLIKIRLPYTTLHQARRIRVPRHVIEPSLLENHPLALDQFPYQTLEDRI